MASCAALSRAVAKSVEFETGESVTFAISDAAIASVILKVGAVDHPVPNTECSKLAAVRFETVSLLWNGSFGSTETANYYYLQFGMGPEVARASGGLPQVRLMFRDGKFAESGVKRKISTNTWQYSDL